MPYVLPIEISAERLGLAAISVPGLTNFSKKLERTGCVSEGLIYTRT